MFVATPSEDVGRGTVHSRQVYRCVLEEEQSTKDTTSAVSAAGRHSSYNCRHLLQRLPIGHSFQIIIFMKVAK